VQTSRPLILTFPSRLWRGLTEPLRPIGDPIRRRNAQLVASALIAVGLLGVVAAALIPTLLDREEIRHIPILLTGFVCLLVAYTLSRLGSYRSAVRLIIAVAYVVVMAVSIPVEQPLTLNLLDFLVLPVILCSLFFSYWATIVYTGFAVAGISLLRLGLGNAFPATLYASTVMFTVMTSTLVILSARHRNFLERERQRQLAQSEALYRTLVNHLPGTSVMLFDRDLRFLMVEGETLFQQEGGSTQVYEGKTLWETTPPQHAQLVYPSYRDTLEGKSSSSEYPKGDHIYHIDMIPLRDAQGEVFAGMVVARDITEQKHSDSALRMSEARHRALLNAIPDLIVRLDRSGRFLDVKPSRYFPPTPPYDSLLGKNVKEVYSPQEVEDILHNVHHVLETGATLVSEYQLKEARGLRDYEARVVPSGDDEVLTIVRDITERKQIDNALRESEARQRALLNAIPDMIVRLDRDGLVVDVKPAKDFAPVFPAEEMAGKNVKALYPPDAAENVLANIRHVLETGEILVEEYQLADERGLRHFEARLVPSGENEALTIVRDITERKQLEKALREEQARTRSILDSASSAIISIDEQQNIVLFNPYAESVFGYAADEVMGKPLSILIPARSREKHLGFVAQFAEEDRASRGMGERSAELFGLRKNGEEFDIRVSISHASIGGKPIMTAILEDVTERKRAEEALRESEERNRMLLESIPVGIILSDIENDKTLYANPASARLLGADSPELLVGASADEFILPEAQEMRSARLARLEAGETMPPQEYRYRRRDGELIDAETQTIPIIYQGQRTALSILQDVSERKRADQQRFELALERERSALLQHFVNEAASHDFRTPLTIMRTSLYLHEKVTDAERKQRHIANVAAQVERLEGIVESLLGMAQLYKSLDQFQTMTVDLNQIVRDVLMGHQQMAERHQHRMEFTPAPIIPPIQAVPTALEQALTHLVRNAILYTPKGGEIRVETEVLPDKLIVSVRDNGVGINEADLPHIFQPFYKTDKARQTGESGMGLGLSIARRIAEMHAGGIEVESQPNVGSTFTLWLPLASVGKRRSLGHSAPGASVNNG
jgi:PAS domain S-box-containing protein